MSRAKVHIDCKPAGVNAAIVRVAQRVMMDRGINNETFTLTIDCYEPVDNPGKMRVEATYDR